MVAPGAGFRGVTLYDVTPLINLSEVLKKQNKNRSSPKIEWVLV